MLINEEDGEGSILRKHYMTFIHTKYKFWKLLTFNDDETT